MDVLVWFLYMHEPRASEKGPLYPLDRSSWPRKMARKQRRTRASFLADNSATFKPHVKPHFKARFYKDWLGLGVSMGHNMGGMISSFHSSSLVEFSVQYMPEILSIIRYTRN